MSVSISIQRNFRDLEFWLHRARLARKRGHYSNFGEQEIIRKYIDRLSIAEQSRTFVDIGASDGIRRSNTFDLVINGWKGVGIEYDSGKAAGLAYAYKFYPNAFACQNLVTPDNVVSLLESYGIETNFGVLSLDLDGYDLPVLDAVLSKFRPRLIVSEINERIPPPVKFSVNYDPDFKALHHFFGYSLASLESLLAKYKFKILELEYNNVFLAPAESVGAEFIEIEQAYRQGYLDRPDRKEKFNWNENTEILHSLNPEECVEFLNKSFAEHSGKYQIGLRGGLQA